jgi:hypothetical protein
MTEWTCIAEETPEGPLGDPKWPLFGVGRKHDRLILYAEIDQYGEPCLLSALPDLGRRDRYMTWLEFEVDNQGSLASIMQLGDWVGEAPFSEEDWILWCLKEGLCPGQVIILDITANYTEDYCWDAGCYEYDLEINWDIIGREHLSPEEHAKRWCEVMDEYDSLAVERGELPYSLTI